MRKRNKIIQVASFILSGVLLIADCNMVAYAGSVENQTVSSNTASVQVTLDIGGDYSVKIPKVIKLDVATRTAEYDVEVEASITNQQYISVEPEYEFEMTDGTDIVTAIVSQDKTEWEATEVVSGSAVKATGKVDASDITIGSWSGSFLYTIDVMNKRFEVIAMDENDNSINATGLYILGQQKHDLSHSLVSSGLVQSLDDVDILIDIQADEFTGTATAIFDVSGQADVGDVIHFYHYDEETSRWEYIGVGVVNDEGKVSCDFTSFSPVVLSIEDGHSHMDADGDGICDGCTSETDVHEHEYADGVCNGCGNSCTHIDINGDGKCDDCTLDTDCHEHIYENGICTGCGASCQHTDENGDGKCDICGSNTDSHIHSYVNGICTGCGNVCSHIDTDKNDICDNCATVLLEPGLYNVSGKMLAAWEDTGIDIETDYTADNYNTSALSPYSVLTTSYPTATKVVLPDYVTHIGNYAFYNHTDIKRVVISNSVESIGDYTFSGCTSLQSTVIPDSVNTLGNYVFSGCTAITDLELSSNITSIGEYAFHECSGLANLVLEEGITVLGEYMFNYCSLLDNVMVPSSIDTISKAAFRHCSSLKNVVLNEGLTSISTNAFSCCIALEKIILPDTLNSLGSQCFYGTALQEIIIPKNVNSIGDKIFNKCTSLSKVEYAEGCTVTGNNTFIGCSSLSYNNIILSDSIQVIGDNLFSERTDITGITLPKDLTTIGTSAFESCTNLADVIIQSIDSKVNINNSAFKGCSSLVNINTNDVCNIGNYAFQDCSSLVNIISLEDIEYIGYNAFENCISLETDIHCEKEIESIGDSAFYNCDALRSVYFSDVKSIGSYAFANCDRLEVAYIENATSIGDYAFSTCVSLEDVQLINVGSIGSYLLEKHNVKSTATDIDNVLIVGKEDGSSTLSTNMLGYHGSNKTGGTRIEKLTIKNIKHMPESCFITKDDTYAWGSAYFKVNNFIIEGVKTFDNRSFWNNTIVNLTIIGDGTTVVDGFYGITSLTSLKLSGVVKIDSQAFDSTKIKGTIELPEGLTHLEKSALEIPIYHCLVLPNSIKSINNFAVDGAGKITYKGVDYLFADRLSLYNQLISDGVRIESSTYFWYKES